MAWLQKRPQVSENIQYYTLGQNKTVLLVGLGNPGPKYALTRHNVGFYALDQFVADATSMSNWTVKKDLHCQLSLGRIGENRVIAIKPTTSMNLSGKAIAETVNFYKIILSNVVVLHDELDVDFGQLRIRIGGSSAGHNGIKSITEQIGQDYGRIRIGIGPKRPLKIDSADFVLDKFSAKEQAQLTSLALEVNVTLNEYLYSGQLPHETRSFII